MELGSGEVIESESTVGGGSLPGESLPTFVLALEVKSTDKLMAKLRAAEPAIIARTEHTRVLLDPRTVLPDQDKTIVSTLKRVLSESPG